MVHNQAREMAYLDPFWVFAIMALAALPLVLLSRHDRTQPLSVVGEHITVLASAAQTGRYEIFFQGGPEGSGPPPHNHPWDEAFYVLRGEVAFGVGDRESLAVEGTLVQVPGGTTHWFRYGRGGGDMLTMTSGEKRVRVASRM